MAYKILEYLLNKKYFFETILKVRLYLNHIKNPEYKLYLFFYKKYIYTDL